MDRDGGVDDARDATGDSADREGVEDTGEGTPRVPRPAWTGLSMSSDMESWWLEHHAPPTPSCNRAALTCVPDTSDQSSLPARPSEPQSSVEASSKSKKLTIACAMWFSGGASHICCEQADVSSGDDVLNPLPAWNGQVPPGSAQSGQKMLDVATAFSGSMIAAFFFEMGGRGGGGGVDVRPTRRDGIGNARSVGGRGGSFFASKSSQLAFKRCSSSKKDMPTCSFPAGTFAAGLAAAGGLRGCSGLLTTFSARVGLSDEGMPRATLSCCDVVAPCATATAWL